MASNACEILAAVKTALESIDGTGSYSYSVPADRVQYRTVPAGGSDSAGNLFGPRPCIVILAPHLEADRPRTVLKYEKSFTVVVGFYLSGDVSELDRQSAFADLERAIVGNASVLALCGPIPTYVGYPYDVNETLPIDGVHMELTFSFEETVGSPG